jgi:aryl carrier-like protein
MMPSTIQVLEALPLTLNGKVDYRALPQPERMQLLTEENFIAPRSEQEKTLAAIWAEVLRLERVGVCDDIFELGADSLLIFQITTRANNAGFDLTPRQLFQHRTILELTQSIGKERKERAEPDAPLAAISREAHRVSLASL